ncbi:hypothetical protein JCM10207_004826 [Rhodosporidiobolus poonsookiae]
MSGNAYIVAFKTDEASVAALDELATSVESKGGSIKHKYNSKIMKGFAGTFSEDVKAELEQHPAIKYIEPDGAVSTM